MFSFGRERKKEEVNVCGKKKKEKPGRILSLGKMQSSCLPASLLGQHLSTEMLCSLLL